MSQRELLLIAAAALLAFWALGAHNRLMALRNAVAAAWGRCDEPLRQRGAAVVALVDALREPLAEEAAAIDGLHQAQQHIDTAATAMRRKPADAEHASALAGAEAPLAAALGRVLALLELHADLRADAALAPHLAVLRDAGPRLAVTRHLFNDAVAAYNAAARQFPTRLLTRLFGFAPAGAL